MLNVCMDKLTIYQFTSYEGRNGFIATASLSIFQNYILPRDKLATSQVTAGVVIKPSIYNDYGMHFI